MSYEYEATAEILKKGVVVMFNLSNRQKCSVIFEKNHIARTFVIIRFLYAH